MSIKSKALEYLSSDKNIITSDSGEGYKIEAVEEALDSLSNDLEKINNLSTGMSLAAAKMADKLMKHLQTLNQHAKPAAELKEILNMYESSRIYKVIQIDNFCRSDVSDILVEENLTKLQAENLTNRLNSSLYDFTDEYYKLVDQHYELYDHIKELYS